MCGDRENTRPRALVSITWAGKGERGREREREGERKREILSLSFIEDVSGKA